VRFRVVIPPLVQKNLLIVNDTRLLPDNQLYFPDPLHPDSIQAPPGQWPSRAELDSFLFARGGAEDPNSHVWTPFRWRYAPDGTMSYPGIFGGYEYDSIYTRTLKNDNVVTLSELVQYSHVVWIADPAGSNVAQALGVNTLYVMSTAGKANTLAAYVALGGKAWLTGGGAVGATLKPWDNTANNNVPPFGIPKFTGTPFGGRPPELVPGRFMYDVPKWQSEIWLAATRGPFNKSIRIPGAGAWTNAKYGVSTPDYSRLPERVRQKTLDRDPLFNLDGTSRYPYRGFDFYDATSSWNAELMPGTLTGRNFILENISTNPDSEVIVSTLDSLLIVQGGSGIPAINQNLGDPQNFSESIIMTYYHGNQSPPFIISGFDLWSASRPDIIGVVDFVLNEVWKLDRQPVDRSPSFGLRAAHLRRR
jgi:hypothetical protein